MAGGSFRVRATVEGGPIHRKGGLLEQTITKDEAVRQFWQVIARAHAEACLKAAQTVQEAPQVEGPPFLYSVGNLGTGTTVARVPLGLPGGRDTMNFFTNLDSASRWSCGA